MHRLFIILSVLLFCYSVHAQKLIKTVADFNIILTNQDLFINKPLDSLLAQMQPPIKFVMATPSNNVLSYVGYFRFSFLDMKAMDSVRRCGETPLTVVVYVKEYFDWDYHRRPKGKETVWTKEDEMNYGKLTMIGFRVYGNATSHPL